MTKKIFKQSKHWQKIETWVENLSKGSIQDISKEARKKYVQRVLSFLNHSNLKPLKIVVNSGNGAAGPTFDAIADELSRIGAPLEFIRVHHEPDHTFPNGIPNPLLPENHAATGDVVKREGADFGVAFDGDFDRCFFFDASGEFVPGEYVVGLLASIFLDKEAGAKLSMTHALFGIRRTLFRTNLVSRFNPRRVTHLSNRRCGLMRRFTVERCRRITIFATLPIVIAG